MTKLLKQTLRQVIYACVDICEHIVKEFIANAGVGRFGIAVLLECNATVRFPLFGKMIIY